MQAVNAAPRPRVCDWFCRWSDWDRIPHRVRTRYWVRTRSSIGVAPSPHRPRPMCHAPLFLLTSRGYLPSRRSVSTQRTACRIISALVVNSIIGVQGIVTKHRWPLTPQSQLFKFAPEPYRSSGERRRFDGAAVFREAPISIGLMLGPGLLLLGLVDDLSEEHRAKVSTKAHPAGNACEPCLCHATKRVRKDYRCLETPAYLLCDCKRVNHPARRGRAHRLQESTSRKLPGWLE